MAIQVSSIEELQKVIMERVKQGINNTENYLINETQKTIKKEVYDKYKNPKRRYKRTYTLRDSVQVTNRNNGTFHYGITIGHNQTANWFSIGDGITYDTPYIVTYGTYGTFIGMADNQFGIYRYHDTTPNGSYSRPRPYMDITVEKLKDGNMYLKHLAKTIGGNVRVK